MAKAAKMAASALLRVLGGLRFRCGLCWLSVGVVGLLSDASTVPAVNCILKMKTDMQRKVHVTRLEVFALRLDLVLSFRCPASRADNIWQHQHPPLFRFLDSVAARDSGVVVAAFGRLLSHSGFVLRR